MLDKGMERVVPALPSVTLSPRAAQKLRLYVELCPYEISGLGEMEVLPAGFQVRDLHLLKQRCSASYTELLPDGVARFLISYLEQGGDPAVLKLWWHSHGEMDVFWSPIDDYTAKGFNNDYMLSLVANKEGDHLCRLDLYQPLKLTLDRLAVVLPAAATAEAGAMREAVRKEIAEQLIVYV